MVAFRGQTVAASANRDGCWTAWLGPLSATPAGADLSVAGDKGGTAVLHDVVVGEVWLCSGQSNMEFVLNDPHNATFRVQDAEAEVNKARFPLIRQFKVARQLAAAPAETVGGSWVPCSPQTAAMFSAVGYFFAREILRKLDVPVGIVASSWGGTVIEGWISPAALAAFPKTSAEPRPPHGFGAQDPGTPSSLFNGMIHPLAPYALRGVLWYQGESDAGEASGYARLFAAMIADWRAQFRQGDIPFYWVQLPNFRYRADPAVNQWALLREAQARALSLPATGQAVTIDIGEPDNLYPRNKQEVGRRLALIARAKIYGIPGDCSGPVFSGAVREGSAMRVHFTFAEGGLTAAGKPLQSFELAGADHRFFPAAAVIAAETVVVRSPEVPAPAAVRYAWRNDPEANLFNGAGLPAMPFRSDAW